MCGLTTCISSHQADLAAAAAKCPAFQEQRPTLSPDAAPLSGGRSGEGENQPATWRQINYIGPLPSQKWQHLVLNGIDTHLGWGLPSLLLVYLGSLTSSSFYRSFSFFKSWDEGMCSSVVKGASFCRSPTTSELEMVRDRCGFKT